MLPLSNDSVTWHSFLKTDFPFITAEVIFHRMGGMKRKELVKLQMQVLVLARRLRN